MRRALGRGGRILARTADRRQVGAECVEMFVQFLGVRVMLCRVERPSLQLLVFTLKRLTRLQQLRVLDGDRIREGGHVQRSAEYSTGPETPAAHAGDSSGPNSWGCRNAVFLVKSPIPTRRPWNAAISPGRRAT